MEGPFSDPGIPDGEETVYRGLIGKEEVGAGSNLVAHGGAGYVQALAMEIRGDATYSASIEFRRSRGTIAAESYRLDTRYRGEPVAVEEGRFRGVKVLQWGGDLETYPRDVAPLLGCAVALRGLSFERGERRSFSLWLANTVWWEIEARVEKLETISLPIGATRAWRVRVRPHFGHIAGALDRLIQLVLPPFVLHFDEQPPHRFLRFSFPTGPFPWNPRGLIEATELR
jgi:hypothetical protein